MRTLHERHQRPSMEPMELDPLHARVVGDLAHVLELPGFEDLTARLEAIRKDISNLVPASELDEDERDWHTILRAWLRVFVEDHGCLTDDIS